jgi:1-acyl-sn-glycerol-3-phosphate acyltransferase
MIPAVLRKLPQLQRPEERLSIGLLRAADVIYSRLFHQVRVLSPSRLPRRGSAILVCNHTSGLDPVLIQSVCKRMIVWMMAKEYYEIGALTWIFKTVEAIAVERSGRDLLATRAALRALADGRVLGVFPEGRIETTHSLIEFQTGVALMAIKSDVPVYPVYITGSQRNKEMPEAFSRRQSATLTFGPEVTLDRSSTSREALDEQTRRIRDAVGLLKKQCDFSRV